MKFYLLVFILLIVNFELVVSKLKKNKKNKIVHPEKSSYKRANDISEGLYCTACKAVIRESIARLFGKTQEYEVLDAT